ncbi:MAG: N-acetylmuramoyl-L-alanine amidase [Terriglobales bacterium]
MRPYKLKTPHSSHRCLPGYAALLILLLSLPVRANTYKSDAWAHGQFAIAEHKREELNKLPPDRQTRREYQDVIESYRRVYYGCPPSSKADASVFAVADVLTGMGEHFGETKILHSAVAQYEFLRREYPGSKYRFEALLNIGRIYANDLDSPDRAKSAFEEFVRKYPRNHFADEARAALTNLAAPSGKISRVVAEASNNSRAELTPARAKDLQQVATQTAVPEDTGKPAHIIAIHHWSKDGYTKVAIDLDHPVSYKSQRIENPDRVVFDLDANLASKLIGKTVDVDDDLLKKIRMAQFKPDRARIVLETGDHSDFSASVEPHPARLLISLKDSRIQTQGLENKDIESSGNFSRDDKDRPGSSHASGERATNTERSTMPLKRIVEADEDDTVAKLDPITPLPPEIRKSPLSSTHASMNHRKSLKVDVREAQPTARGDRSLIRALGLKIGKIVIDPGHGGYDTGTIGPNSLEEKDLVLDVSRRLGKLLESRLGAQVVYTRKDDTFVPLETRTAIANQEQADLFVSVHANSSHDPAARGVETYYLNFSSSPDALEVAARENAVSETSIHELQDLVKQIALKEKIEESREFASDVQEELHSGLSIRNPGLRDRGVKKAPFIVLIGANMPSILAEISFVSNPGDERRLETAAYRQRIAESLYRGISKYVNGLSGVKVASRIEKTTGQ